MLKIIKGSTLVPTPIVDLKLDSEPHQGSTDPVTSEGVKNAIDGAVGDASEALQEQIDEIAEKAGSGYIPKGEATVATLNALSGQENGDLYTMTDSGTLTDGSLAVVAGDTVAWDATNSVWYKAMDYAPRQYGTNEVHNIPTTITAFRTGDVIPVDGPSGTAKMSKDDLLLVTAENADVRLDKSVYEMLDDVVWHIGALTNAGIDNTKTNRICEDAYLEARIGDSISVADGYKFNIAKYDSDHVLVELVSMRTDPYVFDEDCIFRVGFGRTDNADFNDTTEISNLSLNVVKTDKIAELRDDVDGLDSRLTANELATADIYRKTFSQVKPSFVIGALVYTGAYDNTITNRVRFAKRVFVRKGSTISVDDASHKFNLATYTEDSAASMIQYYSMVTGDNPITIPQDCYISSCIGRTDNADIDIDEASHYKLNLIGVGAIEYVNDRISEKYKRPYLDGVSFDKINQGDAIFGDSDSAFGSLDDTSTSANIMSFIDNAIATKNAEDYAVNPNYPYAKKQSIGYDSSGTYPVNKYTLKSPDVIMINGVSDLVKKKPKIIVVAGQHGDEKGSQIACAHLIDLLTNKYADNFVLNWIHWNAELIIVPCANPWGTTTNNYRNYNGVNLNRNWGYNFVKDETPGNGNTGPYAFSEVETRLLRGLFQTNSDACHILDYHTNNATKTEPLPRLTNWFSLPTEDELLNVDMIECVDSHCYKLTSQFNKEYSFRFAPSKRMFYIDQNASNNLLKGYALGVMGIPSLTMECAAKEEGDSGLYIPRMNKMNTEILANWIYNVCLVYSKYAPLVNG